MVSMFTLSSCADARETGTLSPVSSAAISADKDGFTLTAETVFQDGIEGIATPEYLSGTAQTIEQVFDEIKNNVGGEFYFSHAQVIVIDENFAKSGISELCEYLSHKNEVRLDMRICVAKDVTAVDVLKAWAPNGEVPGFALARLLTQGEKRETGVDMPLFRFYDDMLASGESVLPAVTIGQDGTVVPAGTAVFENGVLVGVRS